MEHEPQQPHQPHLHHEDSVRLAATSVGKTALEGEKIALQQPTDEGVEEVARSYKLRRAGSGYVKVYKAGQLSNKQVADYRARNATASITDPTKREAASRELSELYEQELSQLS